MQQPVLVVATLANMVALAQTLLLDSNVTALALATSEIHVSGAFVMSTTPATTAESVS